MVICKVLLLLFLPAVYFGLFVFGPWYDSLLVQASLTAIFLLTHLLRHGAAATKEVLGFLLPFIASLFVFGLFFHWLRFMGRTDWLLDSAIKTLVFPGSFLAVKLALAEITFSDIMRLPLRKTTRRSIIVFRAVMEKCAPLLRRYRFFMSITPHFKTKRWNTLLKFCGALIAAYISIYQQAEETGALFDHRLNFLRPASSSQHDRQQ